MSWSAIKNFGAYNFGKQLIDYTLTKPEMQMGLGGKIILLGVNSAFFYGGCKKLFRGEIRQGTLQVTLGVAGIAASTFILYHTFINGSTKAQELQWRKWSHSEDTYIQVCNFFGCLGPFQCEPLLPTERGYEQFECNINSHSLKIENTGFIVPAAADMGKEGFKNINEMQNALLANDSLPVFS